MDKPLGLTLGESKSAGGGLVVKTASGNAAKAGIQASCCRMQAMHACMPHAPTNRQCDGGIPDWTDLERMRNAAPQRSDEALHDSVMMTALPSLCGTTLQQAGDTVIYASSFFGDELWPADKLSFTNSAVAAAPSPVTFVIVKGENTLINVKRQGASARS